MQYEAQLSEAIARLATLREELKAAIDADAESYNVVMKAYRAARETDDGGVGVNAALSRRRVCRWAWRSDLQKCRGLRRS